ncbi:hypothetical protein [Spirochaeta dissipatitropha]
MSSKVLIGSARRSLIASVLMYIIILLQELFFVNFFFLKEGKFFIIVLFTVGVLLAVLDSTGVKNYFEKLFLKM